MSTCKDCVYCVATVISEVVQGCPVIVRHCHKCAPRDIGSRWPKVDFSEWCGEWEGREEQTTGSDITEEQMLPAKWLRAVKA